MSYFKIRFILLLIKGDVFGTKFQIFEIYLILFC